MTTTYRAATAEETRAYPDSRETTEGLEIPEEPAPRPFCIGPRATGTAATDPYGVTLTSTSTELDGMFALIESARAEHWHEIPDVADGYAHLDRDSNAGRFAGHVLTAALAAMVADRTAPDYQAHANVTAVDTTGRRYFWHMNANRRDHLVISG